MLQTNIVQMNVHSARDEPFTVAVDVKKVGCSRHASRDVARTNRMLEEVRARGYRIHDPVGVCFRSRYLLTNEDAIEVQGSQTSGEVEFAAIVHDGRIFITAASDHNDRTLEESWTATLGKIFDTAKSKQMVPAVVAGDAWPYDEVKDHWDQLRLKSHVTASGRKIPYQDFALGELMNLEYYLNHCPWLKADGSVLLGGSSAILPDVPKHVFQFQSTFEDVTFPNDFHIELVDPVLGRTIRHAYEICSIESPGSLSL